MTEKYGNSLQMLNDTQKKRDTKSEDGLKISISFTSSVFDIFYSATKYYENNTFSHIITSKRQHK